MYAFVQCDKFSKTFPAYIYVGLRIINTFRSRHAKTLHCFKISNCIFYFEKHITLDNIFKHFTEIKKESYFIKLLHLNNEFLCMLSFNVTNSVKPFPLITCRIKE